MAAYLVGATGVTDVSITVARTLSFAAITLASVILVVNLTIYIEEILVPPYQDRWRYLAGCVAAAIVYGVSGLVEIVYQLQTATAFRTGAMLFFFLFGAAGVRALYMSVKIDRHGIDAPSMPEWVWYAIIGALIVVWWSSYLVGPPGLVVIVNTVGLTIAVTYTLVYAFLAVRDAEGTTIAAIIRQFVPALVSFAIVVIAEQAGEYGAIGPGIQIGVELVGTTLVGAFLFTTAVAIRQQSGEVSRMYDRTTWRKQELE